MESLGADFQQAREIFERVALDEEYVDFSPCRPTRPSGDGPPGPHRRDARTGGCRPGSPIRDRAATSPCTRSTSRRTGTSRGSPRPTARRRCRSSTRPPRPWAPTHPSSSGFGHGWPGSRWTTSGSTSRTATGSARTRRRTRRSSRRPSPRRRPGIRHPVQEPGGGDPPAGLRTLELFLAEEGEACSPSQGHLRRAGAGDGRGVRLPRGQVPAPPPGVRDPDRDAAGGPRRTDGDRRPHDPCGRRARHRLHYGTYDYSAALGIAPAQQSLDHPVADHAKAVLQVAAAGTGVFVSDGSTNVLPVGDHRTAAWQLHGPGRRSLERGLYQELDLHPAQLADPVPRDVRVLPRRSPGRPRPAAALPGPAGVRLPRRAGDRRAALADTC